MSIIEEIDAEISRLQQAKAILAGTATKKTVGRPKKADSVSKTGAVPPTKRIMSAEAKAKIAEAQKARWAKSKRAYKKAAKRAAAAKPVPATKVPTKKVATAAKSTKSVKAAKGVKEDKPQA
jgi:hypothetical protein